MGFVTGLKIEKLYYTKGFQGSGNQNIESMVPRLWLDWRSIPPAQESELEGGERLGSGIKIEEAILNKSTYLGLRYGNVGQYLFLSKALETHYVINLKGN